MDILSPTPIHPHLNPAWTTEVFVFFPKDARVISWRLEKVFVPSFSFPFFVMIILGSINSSLNLFSFFVPILSLITHQKNIERLIRGEETKVIFGQNKNNEKDT